MINLKSLLIFVCTFNSVGIILKAQLVMPIPQNINLLLNPIRTRKEKIKKHYLSQVANQVGANLGLHSM